MPRNLCQSHLALAGIEAGSVAAQAENYKRTSFQELNSVYLFVPLVIETGGDFSPTATAFFLMLLAN